MKATKRILASAMALTMAAGAGIGALADDDKIETNGGAATVPVTIAAAQATTFSVKVPSSLPLTIKADGSVEVPTNLMIENDSAGPVKVTKIEATKGSWSLAKFNSDFDAMAVNADKLGFKLNDATTVDSDKSTQTLANFDASKWTIGGNKKLPITVDANASAVSAAVKDVSAASVVFTIAWDEAEGTTQTGGGQSGGGSDTDAGDKVTFTFGDEEYKAEKGTTLGAWLEANGISKVEQAQLLQTSGLGCSYSAGYVGARESFCYFVDSGDITVVYGNSGTFNNGVGITVTANRPDGNYTISMSYMTYAPSNMTKDELKSCDPYDVILTDGVQIKNMTYYHANTVIVTTASVPKPNPDTEPVV